MRADVVVDLSHGDCGKGKVTHSLLDQYDYTHCIRYNGGGNAGHTIMHEGRKFVTHQIPAGVFYKGITSIIGNGCVVNAAAVHAEMEELMEVGLEREAFNNLLIAGNAHVITPRHLIEEAAESRVGTTRTGNGPAYRDKYGRTGKQAKHCLATKSIANVVDLYEHWLENPDAEILCEGAQGFGLDIDWGDYPYVTSSSCTVGGAILNGIPHTAIRNVWGVIKGYETYVGAKSFQGTDPELAELQRIGHEYGATTGRLRQANWLNLDLVQKGAFMNDITHLVVNKLDVMAEVGVYKLFHADKLITFANEDDFITYIYDSLPGVEMYFEYSPEPIDFSL